MLPTLNWTAGFCDANGIDIHFLRTGGHKPPVVLLHGLTGSGACWTPLARALEPGFDVVMPDARGHGQSSTPATCYSYEDHANDAAGVIGALGLSAPVLIGHSMGGMTAALLASWRTPNLRALVLVDPTFLSPQRQQEVWESDAVEQHRRLLGQDKREVVSDLRSRHPRRSPEMIEWIATARHQTRLCTFDVLAPPNPDYRQLVARIEVPTLLVLGDAGIVSLPMAKELQGLNARVRIEVIEDAGHGLPHDRPDRLGSIVRSFLRSLEG